MNKSSYLNALSNEIRTWLPEEEYKNVMEYYGEYFADAGLENEQSVIKELGEPETLARKIVEEYRGKQPMEPIQPKKKGLSAGWVAAIAILGSPLWISLFCIALIFAGLLFGLLLSLVLLAVTFLIVGPFVLVRGIVMAFSWGVTSVLAMGAGLLLLSGGLLLIMLTVFLCSLIGKAFKAMSARKNGRA